MTYELHPLCTLFPRLSGAELDALRDDVKANGLRSPITLHQGMILDGGNRYRACIEAGVDPVFEEFDGTNLVSFVLSANLHRRHMSAGQQAAIVASATDWALSQSRGRPQKPGGPPVFQTVAQRAAVSGANERTQRDADKLVRENPELAAEVTQGRKSLYRAVQETKPAKPAPEPEEDFGPSAEEIAESVADTEADIKAMHAVFEADDKLGAAMAEIKRLNALVRVMQQRIDGLMSEKNEAVRAAKSWQRKAQAAV